MPNGIKRAQLCQGIVGKAISRTQNEQFAIGATNNFTIVKSIPNLRKQTFLLTFPDDSRIDQNPTICLPFV